MSHLVTITTQVRDPVAVTAACRRLSLPAPTDGTFRLYASEATGLAVQLPGWRYPVVCETDSGRLHYDHFQEFPLRPVITILISPEGEIQLETTGFTGPACETASRALIQALGLATREQRTPAFYEVAASDQQAAANTEGSGISPQVSVPLCGYDP